MISYLQIEKLTKSFGDRLLFSDVTLGIYQGDKIGLIAANGAGKTTFLNIIAGVEDYDSGNVVFRNDLKVGYLPQLPHSRLMRPLLIMPLPIPKERMISHVPTAQGKCCISSVSPTSARRCRRCPEGRLREWLLPKCSFPNPTS